MCGIVGAVTHTPVNQLLYDGLLLLQHRGQDAAGIVTSEGPVFHMYKAPGYVRDVFRTRNMRELSGNAGIGHCRDPFGIRPLIIGVNEAMGGTEYVIASESVALEPLGFQVLRDVAPGEAIFVDQTGRFQARQCAENPQLNPCIFEFVYLARPDSVIDGTSVYEARLNMGGELAKKIAGIPAAQDIDVVIPIPDSSRPSALQLANSLGLKYREGFVKNRYIGRTFIMPGQAMRRKSVRQKLNPIGMEFKDKVVLLVDDSIVRGTTSHEIVQMARDAGARKVYFASASPPVRYPNVYGIDMPNQRELIATGRSEAEVAHEIGADLLIYQDLQALKTAVRSANRKLKEFEASRFDGYYVTGVITADYLSNLALERDESRGQASEIDEPLLATG